MLLKKNTESQAETTASTSGLYWFSASKDWVKGSGRRELAGAEVRGEHCAEVGG